MSNRTGTAVHRWAAAAALVAVSLGACTSGSGGGNGRVDGDGSTRIDAGDLGTQLDGLPLIQLAPAEVAGLTRMREEEKLAHDVYVALYDQWQLQTFSNIASAEQTHADAVAALLERHRVPDPAAGNPEGEFTDPDLQSLYTTLVERGQASLVAALTVGATVEDLDIADLQALATDTADIALVYDNLERGSRNHLRAFTEQLTRNDASYSPAYITQAEFDSIVSSDIERGST